MSIWPRKHALKPIRSLHHPHSTSIAAEPLWFLYPPSFRLAFTHPYRTEHAYGKGRRPISLDTRQYSTAVGVSKPKNNDTDPHQRTSSTLRRGSKESADISTSTPKIRDGRPVEKSSTVLENTSLVRKVVLSYRWIPRSSHVPKQEVLERRAHYIRKVNSETVIRLLESIPVESRNSNSHVSRLELSEVARRELLPEHIQENTWLHHDGSGCVAKLCQGYIELRGSERAREIATEYFSCDKHFVRSHEYLEWCKTHWNGSIFSVNDLPPPPIWTVRSFLDYIVIITRPRYRRSAMRHSDIGSVSHHRAVFAKLEIAFAHPVSRNFASTAALDRALSYCRRHTEFPATATRLWKHFSKTGLYPDTGCFNQEFGRCLVNKEFNRFYKIVLEMTDLGIPPNSTTWAVAMAYTERRFSRARLLALAERSSSLNAGRHRHLILTTAKQEFEAHIGTQHGIRRFMQRMAVRFGSDWLTARVLEKLLRICRLRKQNAKLTSELLSEVHLKSGNKVISNSCIVELIRTSANADNLSDALHLVKLEALCPIGDIPQLAINAIFLLAWRKKCFNICRVFWFIAAASGRITFQMQRLVAWSLRSNVGKTEEPIETSWQLLAGKVVIGTNLGTDRFAEIFPELSKTDLRSTPVEWLLKWTPEGPTRNEQIQLGQLLMERDLSAYRFFWYLQRKEWQALLDEAIALDEEWKQASIVTTVSPVDLLTRAVRIPLRPRQMSLRPSSDGMEEVRQRRPFVVNHHELDPTTLRYQNNARIEPAPTSYDSWDQAATSEANPSEFQDKRRRGQEYFKANASERGPSACGEAASGSENAGVEEEQYRMWRGFG